MERLRPLHGVLSASPRFRRRLALCAAALASVVLTVLAASRANAEAPETEFLVIVNPSNPVSALSRDFLSAIFLKKVTRWDNGSPVRPVDLPAESTTRRTFSNRVLRRPVASVKNYWGQ